MIKRNILPPLAADRNVSRLQALRGSKLSAENEVARLKEVAKEFETLLVEMMVKSMRVNVPESPMFGKSNGEEIFQEMLDGEYARAMVENRGFGISDMMVRQLTDKL